jgi:hypothetical protein
MPPPPPSKPFTTTKMAHHLSLYKIDEESRKYLFIYGMF